MSQFSRTNRSLRPLKAWIKPVSLNEALEKLHPHDHLCLIYESEEEWSKAIIPFIGIGLSRGEKCLYLTDVHQAALLRQALSKQNIPAEAYESSGQLAFFHCQDIYTRDGRFDPDRMIALSKDETEKALREGYPVLRVASEASWVLRGIPGSELLLEYESKLNRDFFPLFPCLVICQYDRWRFDPEIVKGVVMTHPFLVRGGRVYENFYNIPTDDFLSQKRGEREVQRWFKNIEREQTKKRYLHFLTDILNNSSQPLAIFYLDGRIARSNRAFCELTGYTPEELENRYWDKELTPPEWWEHEVKVLAEVRRTGQPQRFEKEYIRKDRTRVPVELLVQFATDSEGNPIYYSFIITDISERKKMEKALTESENNHRSLFENFPGIVFKGDINWHPLFIQGQVEEITGYSPEELTNEKMKWLDIVHPDDFEMLNELDREMIQSHQSLSVRKYRIICKDGTIRWIEEHLQFFYDEKGNPKDTQGVMMDITDLKQDEEKIRYLIFHDYLTGLYNRAFFEEELTRLDTPRNFPISLVMGDLDSLKLVNDTFGHAEGDEYLKKIATALRESCRKDDIIARWGGDEFAIILPHATDEEAQMIIKRINDACHQFSEHLAIPFNISIGCATKTKEDESMKDMVKTAEDRMYRRKLLEMKSSRSAVIASLTEALRQKNHGIQEHTDRLRTLSAAFARELGLSTDEIDDLMLLATLHDIGKIAIPESILRKPGPLTPEEWETVFKHPEIGFRIVQSTPELTSIALAILAHHERWDGAGYPQGLKGNHISLLSRILSIIDAFELITSDRPYQKARSIKEATDELKRCAGTQFDPELVERFIAVIQESVS